MNQDELTAYNKQWLENCLKGDLMDHERDLFKVMLEALPAKAPLIIPRQTLLDGIDIDSIDTSKAAPGELVPITITAAGGKILKGRELETFMMFWDAFDHKAVSSRAAAAKSWLKLRKEDKVDTSLAHIVAAAKEEAKKRTDPAKHAQGWLTERRWETFIVEEVVTSENWTLDKWREMMTPWIKANQAWPAYYPGPNPWEALNTEIPAEIRAEYAEKWNWKG